jgi:hypothetical protein
MGFGADGGRGSRGLFRQLVDVAWQWHSELGVSVFVTASFRF